LYTTSKNGATFYEHFCTTAQTRVCYRLPRSASRRD
jgi:hypothetical protein